MNQQFQIPCEACGSTHTTIREVDVHERKVWVACLDCQRLSTQPYPFVDHDLLSPSNDPTDPRR